MKLDNQTIKSALLDGDYLSEEKVSQADKFAESRNISLAEAIFSLDLIKKDYLGQALAEKFNLPFCNIESQSPAAEEVLKIPEEIARKFKVALISEKDGRVLIAVPAPPDQELVAVIGNVFPGKTVSFVFSFPEDIEKLFIFYRRPLTTRFAEIVRTQERVAPEIIDEIIKDALLFEASDIHFEPRGKKVIIRFRISGVLYVAGMIPKEYYLNILNRIKVLANLRSDEHNRTQDGAIRYQTGGNFLDIRVSIAPTVEGEKAAMRILARHVHILSLSDLGFSPEKQELISKAIQKPAGMILVSGPTGSGKTTTLYTILKNLNTPEVNITTIEDPVEYKISGINQIQVNTETELTFARGLRSIVRQDPNIVLVGEIRDTETAEISVNAALTGHLMLSTFHAVDAATTISRLLYMDIEPSILSSTLELIISQRLVRKICPACRHSLTADQEKLKNDLMHPERYFPGQTATLYEGKGCNACQGMGYAGQTAIFEVMPITSEIRELILKKPAASEFAALAKKQGLHSFFEDGIEKVRSGVTTLKELLRVATPPEE